MKYSEFLNLETQLNGQLARADRRLFVIRDILTWAGSIALVLTIADATPWPLGHERPIARLLFILMWSAAMAWWRLSRIHQAGMRRLDGADT